MKKTLVRVIALALVAITLTFCLISCGDIKSGKYYAGDKDITKTYTVYEFNGNKFTKTYYALGNKVTNDSWEGTYDVKDGEITFAWTVNDEEKTSTLAFEKTEAGVKIGAIEYKLIEE